MIQLKPHAHLLPLDDYPDDFFPCHRRVLSARDIRPEQVKKSLTDLCDVALLANVKPAAHRLYDAIVNNEKIIIVGDYDADGATAMSVVVSVLRYVHARFDTVVPNRVTMGYGLSDLAVTEALKKEADVVITVDNGISAVEGVERLKKESVAVIITDHHMPPKELPIADFIINPNYVDCQFPSKNLAGVGVAFYFMLALRQVYREKNDRSLAHFQMADLLPLVAIGTIADVVPLDFNNRILVEQGLKRIRAGLSLPGIKALIDVSGLSANTLSSTEIAFQIAPRLNAAGRIADMQLGVDCLLATNERLAMDYALELDKLNRERKAIENEMKISADQLLLACPINESAKSICLYQADWNEGLVGILASRLKDKYKKTAFVFTRSGDVLKASARAGNGVNVIDALNSFNYQFPAVLINYGGHAKAAGLSLAEEQFELFKRVIDVIIHKQTENQVIDEAIYTDGELLPYELTLENAAFMKQLEPWGMNIPEPIFENTFYIDTIREVGKNHAQMQLIESHSGKNFKGIAFNQFQDYGKLTQQRCRIAYQLSINEWQGRQSLSLIITHVESI